MKKVMFWLLALSLLLLLAACGGSEEGLGDQEENVTVEDATTGTDGEEVNEEQVVGLYDEIMEEGVITAGTEGTYAPFTFHNEEGELTGYDVEVMRAVAEQMGIEVEFEETQWDSMFAALNAGRFDVIANQVGITEERLANYDFSVPYTYSSAVLVVPEGNEEITSFEDIDGLTSAQSLTSNFSAIAEEYGAEVAPVEGLAQSIELIKQGRVDVTINDKLAVLNYINQQEDPGVKIVAEAEDVSESAFAFRQGNEELVAAVDEALIALKEDGTLTAISEEWFGEDVSEK